MNCGSAVARLRGHSQNCNRRSGSSSFKAWNKCDLQRFMFNCFKMRWTLDVEMFNSTEALLKDFWGLLNHEFATICLFSPVVVVLRVTTPWSNSDVTCYIKLLIKLVYLLGLMEKKITKTYSQMLAVETFLQLFTVSTATSKYKSFVPYLDAAPSSRVALYSPVRRNNIIKAIFRRKKTNSNVV